MNKHKRRQALSFFALGLLALILLVGVGKTDRFTEKTEQVAMDGLSLSGRLLQMPQNIVAAVTKSVDEYFVRVATYKEAKSKLAFYHLLESEKVSLEAENARLREMLNMANRIQYKYHTVQPFMDSRSPYAQSLLVSHNGDFNLQKGQAVMSLVGLAGRVITVAENSARVLLLNDRQAYTPVMLLKNSTQAMMRGAHNGAEIVIQTKEFSPKVGDEVVTSGAAGVFPRGLAVGKIAKVENNIATIDLYTKSALLNELMILENPTPGILLEAEVDVQK